MNQTKSLKVQQISKIMSDNAIVIGILIIAVGVGLARPMFFSEANIGNLVSNTAVRFIIAVGVSGCLITRGTDLSAGRTAGFAACLFAIFLQRGDYSDKFYPGLPEPPIWLVIIGVLIICAIIGYANGFVVAHLKVPPFIATLGMQTLVYGICLVYTGAKPIGALRSDYTQAVIGSIEPNMLSFGIATTIIFIPVSIFIYTKILHKKFSVISLLLLPVVVAVSFLYSLLVSLIVPALQINLIGVFMMVLVHVAIVIIIKIAIKQLVTNSTIGELTKTLVKALTLAFDLIYFIYFGLMSYTFLIALGIGLGMWFLYNKTCHGKYMYAIGGNENAAEVAGVNCASSKTKIYILAAVLYGVTGFILAAKSGGASVNTAMGYELEAIAGCTIGGVSTNGGVGRIQGILIGVLVFELLKIAMQFMGIETSYTYIVQGLVIIIAVALDLRKYIAKK